MSRTSWFITKSRNDIAQCQKTRVDSNAFLGTISLCISTLQLKIQISGLAKHWMLFNLHVLILQDQQSEICLSMTWLNHLDQADSASKWQRRWRVILKTPYSCQWNPWYDIMILWQESYDRVITMLKSAGRGIKLPKYLFRILTWLLSYTTPIDVASNVFTNSDFSCICNTVGIAFPLLTGGRIQQVDKFFIV